MLSLIGGLSRKLLYNIYKGCEKYDKYEFKKLTKKV